MGSSNGIVDTGTRLSLQGQSLQVFAERLAQIASLECKLNSGFQEPELIPGIVPLAFKFVSVNGPVAQQMFQRIGQLNLAARAWGNRLNAVEDLRHQNVPPYDCEIRRRIGRFGLLYHVADSK